MAYDVYTDRTTPEGRRLAELRTTQAPAGLKTAHFVDHNRMAVALAFLGGARKSTDITSVPATGCPEFELVRHVVVEALAGRARLVTSDACLRTLLRTLVRGGDDFEALHPQTARECITLLKVISRASGGFVSDAALQALVPTANHATREHHGKAKGQIDHEDVVVVATLLAAIDAHASGVQAMLSTGDKGLHNCTAALYPLHVLVSSGEKAMVTEYQFISLSQVA